MYRTVSIAASLLCLWSPWAICQTKEFKETSFELLSDRNITPLGVQALAVRKTDWKHAESAHFVFHFFQSFVAAPMSVEAEFFYSVVAKELGKDTSQWERKCHVFVFDKASDWAAFQTRGKLDPWTGGLCAAGELFVLREADRKWKGDTLGHEVTHLVLYRFLGSGIPVWLNEGFAEYAASRGYASFWRARGYRASPRAPAVDPSKWLALATLTSAVSYPEDPLQVGTFYDQSHRLVRFLAAQDPAGFRKFLEAMAQGNRFDTALLRGFPGKFPSLDALEKAAKDYATKDHGTSVQDQQ